MKRRICILGGTGFVGHHVISSLAREGHSIRVLTRRREEHRELLVMPTVEVFDANVHDESSLNRFFADQDAVINLVGILNERHDNGKGFYHAHVELSDKVIRTCRTHGIERLLHMSALNADPGTGSSYYLRSKGEAEHRVHAAGDLNVTSFRPSVIFGPEDSFINRFASLLKKTPWLFPLACANARFAPVYVRDVADAFSQSLNDPNTYGQRYNLCGPHEYTLQEVVERIIETLDIRRRVIPLGRLGSALQANLLEYAPGKPFSRDNYRSLQMDSICPEGDQVLREVFGIEPAALEAIMPQYLRHETWRTRYQLFRSKARRD
ncbi:MAG: complex I NDUFA9 subunit family protein [Thiohalophilus sp.]|uniref:complex I NDUFA9 subunit family protein n=1 Tax=Thiohalophilus sp. TaxID=3028392 RepID=UPI002870A907|nr:complex I NDUFA9 subunit family protein [Thiohalophilus sp.]MDR9436534.1 complex I NDUFA9 subunit family protein [Thiohalophilus sp.]